jgi:hypothetical protein
MEVIMADILYVGLVLVFFALCYGILKGLEKL